MGADLYIQPKFDEEYQIRKAADGIENMYKHLYGDNPYYFRDSYNDWSVMSKLDLSWWNDAIGFLNDEGEMLPEQTAKWLEVIKSRQEQFEDNITDEDTDTQKYFRDKYQRLQEFYQRAIDLNLSVDHSV